LSNANSMPVISPLLPGRHVINIPYPIVHRGVQVYYLYFDKLSYLFM